MDFVTIELFFWVIGGLLAICVGLIGYWIKEIVRVDKKLSRHTKGDEKCFYESQRENDSEHARLEALINQKTNVIEQSFARMETKLNYIVDELKKLNSK